MKKKVAIIDRSVAEQVDFRYLLNKICTSNDVHVYIPHLVYKRLEQSIDGDKSRFTEDYIKNNIKNTTDFIFKVSQSQGGSKKLFNGGISLDNIVSGKSCLLSIKRAEKSVNQDVKLLGVIDLATKIKNDHKGEGELIIEIWSTRGSLLLEADLRGFNPISLDTENSVYKGYRDKFSKSEELLLSKGGSISGSFENEYFIFGSDAWRHAKGDRKKTNFEKESITGINAYDIHQKIYLDLLMNEKISVVTSTGKAGSGKTLLPIAVAVHLLKEEKIKKIYVARAAVSYEDTGFKPGDAKEKVMGYMKPILDNLYFLAGQKGVDKKLIIGLISDLTTPRDKIENPTLEVMPLEEVQGRTLNDAFVIVDEAQNLTKTQIVSLITRMGRSGKNDSKIVLSGDIHQISNPRINPYTSGLAIAVRTLKASTITGHIHLEGCIRSKTAALGDCFY